jgi:general secretion pathway protein B
MSFILDALRKSEIERQRQSGPSMAEFPIAREDRRLPVALIAIVVLLAVNIGVLLFFLLRDKAAPAAAASQVAIEAPSSMTSAPPPGAAAPAPAPATAATAAPPTPDAVSPLEAEAAGGDDYSESAPPIYGTPSTLPPEAPDPTLIPEAQPSRPGVVYGEAPATEDASAVVASAGLPELTVDLHIYSEIPAKRAVFINGRRYVQGDHIAEGPVVEQITREGAMLSYRGRRFLLPRL